MDQRSQGYGGGASLGGPGWMLLSAAIFGYFGFGIGWTHTTISGNFVFFFALLDYTVKGSAIAYLVAALVTFVKPLPGNLLYGVAGVIGAALLLIVAAMDFVDKQHIAAIHPLLLLIFVAWNGFSSFAGLREAVGVMRARSAASSDRTFMSE